MDELKGRSDMRAPDILIYPQKPGSFVLPHRVHLEIMELIHNASEDHKTLSTQQFATFLGFSFVFMFIVLMGEK